MCCLADDAPSELTILTFTSVEGEVHFDFHFVFIYDNLFSVFGFDFRWFLSHPPCAWQQQQQHQQQLLLISGQMLLMAPVSHRSRNFNCHANFSLGNSNNNINNNNNVSVAVAHAKNKKKKERKKGRKQKTCLVFVHFWYRFIFGSLFSIMCASFTHIFDGVPASGAGAKQVYCDKCPKTGQRLPDHLPACSPAHHRSVSLDVSSQICALRIRRVCLCTHKERTQHAQFTTHGQRTHCIRYESGRGSS